MSAGVTLGLEALLSSAVDYAGLFPPAALPMTDAVDRFRRHRKGREGWMLGRFVLPVARLEEFGAVALRPEYAGQDPWPLSVLLPAEPDEELRRLERFLTRWDGEVRCASFEVGPVEPSGVGALADRLPEGVVTYFEVPAGDGADALLDAVHRAGGRVKVRTGGMVAEAIPSATDIASFLCRCRELDLPFKATAGLHHPVRSEQALTYEPGAARATMHGFLNLGIAAALVHADDVSAETAAAALQAMAHEMRFDDGGASWRGHRLPLEGIGRSRSQFFQSFGSCSFAEPVHDLKELSLL